MSDSQASTRNFGLDLLRSTAIGFVLLCHFLLTLRFCWKGVTGWSVLAGYYGVELFFVLSGFLIGGILIRDFEERGPSRGTLAHFWSRRWLRTLPNYFLFLGINVLVAWSLTNQVPHWSSHAWFGQNLTQAPGKFFPEAWSLAVEEWFYLLTPLVVLAVVKAGVSVRKAVLWVAVLGIVGVSCWRMYYVASTNPSWMLGTRQVVFVRLDACMFGVLAACWRHSSERTWFSARWVKLALGVSCLVTVGWMFRHLRVDESFVARTHFFTLTSLGAALCLPALESLRTAGGKAAVAIGHLSRWSYSLYLVNFLIFQWLARESGLGLFEVSTALIAATTALFLSIVASMLLYHGFELPILKLRDRWTNRARATPPIAPRGGSVGVEPVPTTQA